MYDGRVLGVHVSHCRTGFKEHPQHLSWGELERPHNILHSTTWRSGGGGGGGGGGREREGIGGERTRGRGGRGREGGQRRGGGTTSMRELITLPTNLPISAASEVRNHIVKSELQTLTLTLIHAKSQP